MADQIIEQVSDVQLDYLGANGQARGALAASMVDDDFNIHAMRPWRKGNVTYMNAWNGKGSPADPKNYKPVRVHNATGLLRRNEWEQLDQAVIGVAEERLTGIGDLESMGLTYDIDGMSNTVLVYHTISDALEAELSMDAVARAQDDTQEFDAVFLPLPIAHVDYRINTRRLRVSRKLGNGLDTTMVERATRKISERWEKMLFQAGVYSAFGGKIVPYTDSSVSVAYQLEAVNSKRKWNEKISQTASTLNPTGPRSIINDMINMKQELLDEHMYGPYYVYVPSAYETVLDEDYDVTTSSGRTIRERILQIEKINDIKVADFLPADTIIMVQMTRDVVRLVRGMALQNLQEMEEMGMSNRFKVMGIKVPQIRVTSNGKKGVCVGRLT